MELTIDAPLTQPELPLPDAQASIIPLPQREARKSSSGQEETSIKPTDHDASSSSSAWGEDNHGRLVAERSLVTSEKECIDGKLSDDVLKQRLRSASNDNLSTRNNFSRRDGRLEIDFNKTNARGHLTKILGTLLTGNLRLKPEDLGAGTLNSAADPLSTEVSQLPLPRLDIVIMVIGSRGDVQPFLKIGKILNEEHGHRVRIATHPAFQNCVQDQSGLEFFSVGGDPAELMAFMVKNPNMIPSLKSIRDGDIGRRRDQMAEMFEGFWRACINPGDDEKDAQNSQAMSRQPFVADVIIANPPSYAHIHCAEKLGIPLHIMFTFPYTPTKVFPHPMANIRTTRTDLDYVNFISFPLIEIMTWQGLGDLLNNFRVNTLGLDPVSLSSALRQLYQQKIPHTYMWSPGLVSKPFDWGPGINITGFVYSGPDTTFEPPEELVKFLADGDPPIYIGFGSVIVDDPDDFTKVIFEAVEMAGVRALISNGWDSLGEDNILPQNVYILKSTPHDWLFPKVSAVIHHGGAGTTAIGLKCGKPTMIVPFFGDQHFWGSAIENAGAGPRAVPYRDLTVKNLADGIRHCLTDNVKKSAQKLAEVIEAEGNGAQNAVKSFHRSLKLQGKHSMRCSILEDRVAVWSFKDTNLRLSALAAVILVEKKNALAWGQLRLLRHGEWNDFEGPGDPLTGGVIAIAASLTGIATGVGGVPFTIANRRRHKHDKAKQAKSEEVNRRLRDIRHELIADPEFDFGSGGDVNAAEEYAQDAGKGVIKSGESIARMPLDLLMAVAQGFHNAPRLYGDTTVRRPSRITGFHSGLKAGAEAFTYGIYDGFTGILVHPCIGARDEGLVGFMKGFGIGIMGFVLKDLAAMIGPCAYAMKGIHKELCKSKQPTSVIRKAHMLQGQGELQGLSEEAREMSEKAVNHTWSVIQQILQDSLGRRHRKGINGLLLAMKQKKNSFTVDEFGNSAGTSRQI